MNRFFIVKTITGNIYTGLINRRYNTISIDLKDVDRIKINNTQIPVSNVDYVKTDVSYREWLETCEELGITDTADYKQSLIQYHSEKVTNIDLMKALLYFNDWIK